MDSKRWWESRGLVAVCVLSSALCGCTSADLLTLKDREIAELRSEKAHLRESLAEAIARIDQLRESVKEVEQAKETSTKEAEELRTRLQFTTDELEGAARDREKLKTRADDAEAQVAMLERSLNKVKSVASDSVSELTDLRIRSKSFQEELAKLRTENLSMSQERSKLQSKVNVQHDELTKLKAVVRALRTGSKERKLEATIAELRKEAADLRGENVALSIRFENLAAREAELSKALAKQSKGAGASEGSTESIVRPAGAQDLVYISDPVGLFDEMVGFAKARYMKALTGHVDWDVVDKAAVTVATLFLFFVFVHLFRSRRLRKLKRQVQDLRAELYELEAESETADEYEEDDDRPRGPRRKPNLRRGGFSAVIAGPGGQPAAAQAPPSAAPVDETAQETVVIGAASRPAVAAASAPAPAPVASRAEAGEGDSGSRKVIGARTWEDEESLSLDEESLERTQLIQLTPEELGSRKLIVPSVPGPSASAKARTIEFTSGSGEESTSTAENKTKEMKKAPDLLAELKSAVNSKLDSL